MNEQILEKVQKLLALSQSDNINESSVAYKQAQKLLARHRLTMADVRAVSNQKSAPITVGDSPLYEGARAISWRGMLAVAVCKANQCSCFWNRESKNRKKLRCLTVIGRQEDIEIVHYLYNNIADQIDALCKAAMIANRGGGKTFSNNFRVGAVNVVSRRLQEAKEEVELEHDGTAAMVLVKKDNAELEKFVKSMNLKQHKVSYRVDRHGRALGEEAGKRVDLSRGKMNQSQARGYLND